MHETGDMQDPSPAPAPNAGDVVLVEGDRAACDGGGDPLGHPVTYYRLGGDGEAICKYCDRHFVRAGSPAARRLGLE